MTGTTPQTTSRREPTIRPTRRLLGLVALLLTAMALAFLLALSLSEPLMAVIPA